MTDDQLVISPAQAAAILGVDPSTVRRWVREGACPDAFAALPSRHFHVTARRSAPFDALPIRACFRCVKQG